TSLYRKELLQRMGIAFKTVAPDVDESSLPGESPENLVKRLAEAKARVIGKTCEALIIGSDQVAVSGDEILGKPGSHENALVQLRKLSGKLVTFQTGLCLLNSTSNEMQVDTVPFRVQFRKLDEQQIERYLRADQPYNCAGSFKSEGLGITLFERMDGDDPTALIGLPLIRLTSMLMQAGVVLP
ncbi:MAG: Maf family nucleotide pyrophosphatase, partial [Gammaproteobacteria bacterium]|nr:Maf family nucleotide pyrophosphatase [Gammaproteobacteria bacterium]